MTCLSEQDLQKNKDYYRQREESNLEGGLSVCISLLLGVVIILLAVSFGGLR